MQRLLMQHLVMMESTEGLNGQPIRSSNIAISNIMHIDMNT